MKRPRKRRVFATLKRRAGISITAEIRTRWAKRMRGVVPIEGGDDDCGTPFHGPSDICESDLGELFDHHFRGDAGLLRERRPGLGEGILNLNIT